MSRKHILYCILFAVISRLLPHPPNVTPVIGLSVLSGIYGDKRSRVIILVISMLCSDLLLSIVNGQSFFGEWTLFTYSGLLMTAMISSWVLNNKKGALNVLITMTVIGSILFWMWTNFGTWLTSGLYPHTMSGVVNCYLEALPFLKNAMLSSGIFVVIFNCVPGYFNSKQKSRLCPIIP